MQTVDIDGDDGYELSFVGGSQVCYLIGNDVILVNRGVLSPGGFNLEHCRDDML